MEKAITPTREFWMCLRNALLSVVDAIERMLDITPTTAQIRRQARGRCEETL
jgi:hypothetical protein